MDLQNNPAVMATLIEMAGGGDGKQPDINRLNEMVMDYLETADTRGKLEMLIGQFVSLVGLETLLPEQYSKFQPAVIEGMKFILSEIPRERLAGKIVDQIMLSPEVSQGRRLCVLVQDLPSLQKLGQIICRSPGLDLEFKKSLVDLEDNTRTLSYGQIEQLVGRELKSMGPEFSIIPERHIMAEASVCVVIRASAYQEDKKDEYPVVLKLVKPAVRKNLPEELDLMGRLARHLEHHRKKLGLDGIAFKDIFIRVRHLLENEINLTMEQENLETAGAYYNGARTMTVPKKIPCSTSSMTVMSEVESTKITDVEHLSPEHRRLLVEAVARYCILKPFQDLGKESIFHGDPHAGNIGYWFDGSMPRIVLYDWGMTGKLSWIERFCLALWVTGIVAKSEKTIYYAIDIVSKGQLSESPQRSSNAKGVIKRILSGRENRFDGLLSVIEEMVEELLRQGINFPENLLMFEKALITLKGVMQDTDPGFNRDDYILLAAAQQLLKNLIYLRYHRIIAKQVFSLYRYNFARLWEVQKIIFRLLRYALGRPLKILLA